jgi:MinD-like ATPase involved in chromosome partitioning or flagellar assembly
MSKIVTIHSFGRAAGRSTLTANLSALLAQNGQRVGVVDMDFQAPSLHLFYGLREADLPHTLNDFLRGSCSMAEVAQDLSQRLGLPAAGCLIFVPSSPAVGDVLEMLRSPYNLETLSKAVQDMLVDYNLDMLLLDTSPGMTEDTLLAAALSDVMIILLHPDAYDYQGTAVSIEVARKLQVPRILVALNATPGDVDAEQAASDLAQCYTCEVGAILPSSESLLSLASSRLMPVEFPHDPFTESLRALAKKI